MYLISKNHDVVLCPRKARLFVQVPPSASESMRRLLLQQIFPRQVVLRPRGREVGAPWWESSRSPSPRRARRSILVADEHPPRKGDQHPPHPPGAREARARHPHPGSPWFVSPLTLVFFALFHKPHWPGWSPLRGKGEEMGALSHARPPTHGARGRALAGRGGAQALKSGAGTGSLALSEPCLRRKRNGRKVLNTASGSQQVCKTVGCYS